VAIEIGQWDQPGRIARPAAEQHVVVAAAPAAASPVYGGCRRDLSVPFTVPATRFGGENRIEMKFKNNERSEAIKWQQ